jgi:hypothetical protein
MLYNSDTKELIERIPHLAEYNEILSRLKQEEILDIKAEINIKVGIEEVKVSGWLPGSDWTGTPFAPIFVACKSNRELAGKIFGLFVWDVMMKRTDDWSFIRGAKIGEVPIESTVYFKIEL